MIDVDTRQLEDAFNRWQEQINKELKEAEEGRGELVLRIMDKVGDLDIKQAASLFASQGASGGEQWAELSPAYEERKSREYPGKKILARKGALRASLTSRGNPEHVLDVRNGMIRMGTKHWKAAVHADPDKHGRPDLPARDSIQKTDAQIQQLKEVFAKVILQRFDELSGGAILRNPKLRTLAASLGRPQRKGKR